MKIAIAKDREIKNQSKGHWVYIPVETVKENNLIVKGNTKSKGKTLKYSLIIIEAHNLIIDSKEKLYELFKSIIEKLSPLPIKNMVNTERQDFSEEIISDLKECIMNRN